MLSGPFRITRFCGEKDEDGYPHGLGLATMEVDSAYNNEIVCAGEWLHGRRHGRCVVSRPECFHYVGDFTDDVYNGDGLLADFEKDCRFYGKFRNGAFVEGRVVKPKVMFEGQVGPDKKLTGWGFRQNINGFLTVGNFKNGKTHGVAFLRWQRQDETTKDDATKQQPSGRYIVL